MLRKNYWSNTKFADWVRGVKKPNSATSEGWDVWRQQAKKKKIRYWLSEEGLDHLQNIVFFPIDLFDTMKFYSYNRWVSKTHSLNSKLKKGQYFDLDTRLLHCVFDELVDFVEIELAWLEYGSLDDISRFRKPWYQRIFQMGRWRCSELGLNYLNWKMSLKHDEEWVDKSAPDYGKPTEQAQNAKEILTLYRWWKEERALRPDSLLASGYREGCENKSEIFHKSFEIEEAYSEEDTEMLVRVIKIRRSLWT